MNGKKWLIINLSTVLFIIVIVGTFNYIIDPYGLNRWIKIDHINAEKFSNTYLTTRFQANALEKGTYDTLLLGSSRIGVMNPEVVNQYLDGNAFNAGQPRSRTDVHYFTLLYANKFNALKNVIYGIDFLSFNKNNRPTEDWEELKEKIKNQKRIYNFDLYFNYDTLIKNIKLVRDNILGNKVDKQRTPAIYVPSNGMRKHILYIEELKNGKLDLKNEIKNHMKEYFGEKTASIYKNYTFSDEYFEYFRKTVQFCKDNNIRLWVYMPPMYGKQFDAIYAAGYFDEYENYERNVSQVTDFMDFTGHNSISDNINNYWDSSHLREEMTKIIMAKIFNDTLVSVPKDIATTVTKNNIDIHLDDLRKGIKAFDLKSIFQKSDTDHNKKME